MYFLVAVMADRQCFALFRYHHLLPGFFSFQIFHLVHMMDFQFYVCSAA